MVRFSARILLPILIACICILAFLGYIWWQLLQSSQLLTLEPNPPVVTGATIQTIPSTNTTEPLINSSLQAIRQGDMHALQGNWTAAAEQYAIAVQRNGGLAALRKLAQAQLEKRDFVALQNTIARLKSSGAKEADMVLLESIVALRTGKLTEAKNILTASPDAPQKFYGLSLLSIAEGNHEEAQKNIQLVLSGLEPVLRNNARTIQDAYDEYNLFTDGSNIHLVTLVARALSQIEECELALPLLSQVTKMQPDYRDAWIVQGYCELFTERVDTSIYSFKKAYELDPQKTATQYFLGRAYFRSGDFNNALTFFEYALSNGFTPSSEVRRYIADTALQLQKPDVAFAQYVLLLETEPTEAIFSSTIELALQLQKFTEAYDLSLRMTKEYSKNSMAFTYLGKSASATNNLSEAMQAYETAIALEPANTVAIDALKALQE